MTFAIDGEVDYASAKLGRKRKIALTRVDDSTFRSRFPPGKPRPQLLSLFVRYDHFGESG